MKRAPSPLNQLKKILLTAVIALIGFSLPACSFLKDKNASVSEPRKLGMGDTACLSDSKKTMVGYLEGHEPVENVEAVFDCLVKAVTTFTSKTRGASSAEGYTLEEIQQFILEFFKDPNSLSSKLLSIGFEIKATAIGGRASNITRVEIEKVKEILLELKTSVRELDPHMHILLGRAKAVDQVAPERVDQAVEALNKFVAKVSKKFDDTQGSPLSIDRVFDLLKTLRSDDRESLDKYSLLASNLKSVLISGPKDKIRSDEWTALLKTAANLYGIVVRYKLGLENQEIGKGHTVKAASALFDDVVEVLKTAASRNDNNMISSDRIHELILNYEKVYGELPMKIKSSSLAPLYPKIFTQVLRPSRISAYPLNEAAETGRPLGIGNLEVQAIQYYGVNYLDGLTLAQDLFKNQDTRSGADLIADLDARLKDLNALQPKSATDRARLITKRTIILAYKIILDPNRRSLLQTEVFSSGEGKLEAPHIGERRDAHYKLDDLIRLNSIRLTVELVLRSFTVDVKRARSVDGLNTDEAEALYRDMRRIGFDRGVADPRSQRAGHRTFMEANLFMSGSNGDDYIKYREGVEWFDFVSASGAHAVEILDNARTQSLARSGSTKLSVDIFGKEKVEINSFRVHLRDNFARYFANLPGMVKFVEQLNRENKYHVFQQGLENAARPLGHTSYPMDSSTMRTVVPIIYYTESIFTRYDVNKSGILENEEAWAIFPIMKNTINDVSHGAANTEWKQKMVFARLLLTGEPPPDDWRKYLSTPLDWLKEKWYKPSTDRLGIINLIGAIAQTSRTTAIKAINDLYGAKHATIQSEFRSGSVVILDQLHELSRCSPDSLNRFRKVMQLQSGYIFAPSKDGKKYSGDTFVFRLQKVIQSDIPTGNPQAGLHEQCQHMLRL